MPPLVCSFIHMMIILSNQFRGSLGDIVYGRSEGVATNDVPGVTTAVTDAGWKAAMAARPGAEKTSGS